MSTPSEAPQLSGEAAVQALQPILFADNHNGHVLHTYAVLDGAAVPELLDQLYGDEPPEFVCLYSGDLEPDMAECAPYLIELTPDSAFTKWLLSAGWGKKWGIFAQSPENLKTMRRHFRTFLMVKDPDGKQVYFRYYDPRVLRVFLPTCTAGETELLFGPLVSYACEADRPDALLSFRVESGLPKCISSKLN
ncbi:MAG: DUF4123 domain-containing protein [Chthoniobacteraceae bacterium]